MGLYVKMLKSRISAINFATGLMAATDHIRLNGAAFSARLPNQAHKQLGISMALTGDFSQENAYVLWEMIRHLSAPRPTWTACQ
jgi:hypothetical protein